MSNFNSFVSTIKRNGVARASNFFCNILPPQSLMGVPATIRDIIPFYVDAVNIPEISLSTRSIKDYGLNREVVVDKNYGTCTMTFHADSNMSIKMFFDEWLRSTIVRKGGIFAYPETYTAETLQVYHLDVAKNATYIINMNNVYPKIVDDIQMSNESKGLMTFRVQFVYESWDSYQVDATDPNIALQAGGDNIRRAWNLIQLIRTGANKDAIKSAVINVGARKIYDIIGSTGIDARVSKSIDEIIGNSGAGDILKSVSGIFI